MGYLTPYKIRTTNRELICLNEQVGQGWEEAVITEIAIPVGKWLVEKTGLFGQISASDARKKIYNAYISQGVPPELLSQQNVWDAMEKRKNSKWVSPGYTIVGQYKKTEGGGIQTYYLSFSPTKLQEIITKNIPAANKKACQAAGKLWTGTACIERDTGEPGWLEAGMLKNVLLFMVFGSLIGGGYMLYEKWKKPKALKRG